MGSVFTQAETDKSSALTLSKYGITNPSGVDNTAKFQSFLDELQSGHRGFVTETVRADGQLTIAPGARLIFAGGAKIDNRAYDAEGGGGSVRAASSIAGYAAITGAATIGGLSLTIAEADRAKFTSAVLISAMIKVQDDSEFSDSGSGAVIRNQEWNRIEAYDQATGALTLAWGLRHGYAEAQNGKVMLFDSLASNITVEGLEIIGDETAFNGKNGSIGLRFENALNIAVRNSGARDYSGAGIIFDGCFGFSALDCFSQMARTTGSGYGLSVLNASENFDIRASGVSNRHCISMASSTQLDGFYRGVVRNGRVSRGASYGSAFAYDAGTGAEDTTSGGDAIDAHSNTENVAFDNLIIHGASGHGIAYEGRNPVIRGAQISDVNGSGIYLRNRTVLDSIAHVEARVSRWGNGQSLTSSFSALHVINKLEATRGETKEVYAKIHASEPGPYGAYGVHMRCYNGAAFERGGVELNGNLDGLTQRPIYAEAISNARITGRFKCDAEVMQIDAGANLVFDLGVLTSSTGIDLNAVTNSSGNLNIEKTGATSGNGITMDANCTGNRFSGHLTNFNDETSGGGASNTFNNTAI